MQSIDFKFLLQTLGFVVASAFREVARNTCPICCVLVFAVIVLGVLRVLRGVQEMQH